MDTQAYIRLILILLFLPLISGVVNVDGKLWKEQRKFLHEQLRRFGMKQVGAGKEQLEARIMVRHSISFIIHSLINRNESEFAE